MEENQYLNLDDLLTDESTSQITYTEDIVELSDEVILPETLKALKENPPYVEQMLQRIDAMDEYAHNRGTMGLDFGMQNLNNAFNGLNPGLTLVAGGANTGKSMLLLEIMRRVITHNQYQTEDHPKKAYCLYFSLDDSRNELMPRMIASDQRITINQALFPKTLVDKPVILSKRQAGVDNLRQNAAYFSMYDATEGQTIQDIEEIIESHREQLELIHPGEFQMVVFIDNFHDIGFRSDSLFMEDNQKHDYIADRLSKLSVAYDLPIMCSAEFKKISEHKRPENENVKSSGKIVYEAKGIILVYNEVGVKGESADIYWNLSDSSGEVADRKMPVLEMHISKNKFGSYKGRTFLKFMPEMASFFESSDEEEQIFRQMVRG